MKGKKEEVRVEVSEQRGESKEIRIELLNCNSNNE